MNFQPSEAQTLIAESFARFLDEHSSMARVRAAAPTGADAALWRGIAEMGGFGIRVPEAAGGLGLGLLDAALVAAEMGRTLVSGPVIEGMVAARILALLSGGAAEQLRSKLLAGEIVVTLALKDATREPRQWVPGATAADWILACDGRTVFAITPASGEAALEPNLASTGIAEITLGSSGRRVLGEGAAAVAAFAAGLEEWKILMAAALSGLSQEALRLATAYASQRQAFGQLIGTYQGVSHPLADLATDAQGGRFLVWKTIRDIADGTAAAGAEISMSLWWNTRTAGLVGAQALHTFGGYGLTTEYDIHLYNLRSKAWPLALGDPRRLIEEASRRLYAGEQTVLPEAGEVSIDFDYGAEAKSLATEVDAFFKANLTPELKAKAHFSFDGHDPGLHRKIAQARLLFPHWPREFGGREAGPYAHSAAVGVWEEHDWSYHGVATTNMIGTCMRKFGSDEVKQEVLARVAQGDSICSLGFSEPGSGSDVFAAKTRATRDGAGWRIDGQKMFTSGANVADYVMLLARTNPDVPKHRGLTVFIVPLKTPGITIQAVHTFGDERTNITYYDGVWIPDSYRLGDVDAGVKVMSASLEMEHGGSFVKTQRRMLRVAEQVCRETLRDGRPMIEDVLVAVQLATVATHNAVSEVLTYYSLWCAAERKPNKGQGSMCKLFSSEKFRTDSADLLDLTAPASLSKRAGPLGFLNQCYRHSQGTTIYAGTSEIHRSMIAERALSLPRTRA
jgi:alkylation response protein AidB-like acyl-CoA dehydrogenase